MGVPLYADLGKSTNALLFKDYKDFYPKVEVNSKLQNGVVRTMLINSSFLLRLEL